MIQLGIDYSVSFFLCQGFSSNLQIQFYQLIMPEEFSSIVLLDTFLCFHMFCFILQKFHSCVCWIFSVWHFGSYVYHLSQIILPAFIDKSCSSNYNILAQSFWMVTLILASQYFARGLRKYMLSLNILIYFDSSVIIFGRYFMLCDLRLSCALLYLLFLFWVSFKREKFHFQLKVSELVLIAVLQFWYKNGVVGNDHFLLDAHFMPSLCIEVL